MPSAALHSPSVAFSKLAATAVLVMASAAAVSAVPVGGADDLFGRVRYSEPVQYTVIKQK